MKADDESSLREDLMMGMNRVQFQPCLLLPKFIEPACSARVYPISTVGFPGRLRGLRVLGKPTR